MIAFRRTLDIAIDLGTANTLVFVKGQGIVLDEPSIVAVKTRHGTSTVVAAGHAAKAMEGRTPSAMVTVRPMKAGVIANFELCQIMLQVFLRRAIKRSLLPRRVRVVVCVPSASTLIERRAIRETVLGAGASAGYLIEEPMAAALGAGLPIEQAMGSMIVDIGGGTTDIAVFSLNGVVYKNSIKYAGDFADELIVAYVRRHYSLIIGASSAEKLKISLSQPNQTAIELTGRRLVDGLPHRVEVTALQLQAVFRELFEAILIEIRQCLEHTPAELATDVADKGIALTGGGANLLGLANSIAQHSGMQTFTLDTSLNCVINGAGLALDRLDSPSARDIFT